MTQVDWVRRAVSQKLRVSNDSTSAIEPPRSSMRLIVLVPLAWNSGRFTKVRSFSFTASSTSAVDAVCRYEHSTPFDGPVVPEV